MSIGRNTHPSAFHPIHLHPHARAIKAQASWLAWWRATINTDDYFKYLSTKVSSLPFRVRILSEQWFTIVPGPATTKRYYLSFEKSCFRVRLRETLCHNSFCNVEKSCLSQKLFVTHSSVGNRVIVRTRSKVWRLMNISFGRLRSVCYISQSNRTRKVTRGSD